MLNFFKSFKQTFVFVVILAVAGEIREGVVKLISAKLGQGLVLVVVFSILIFEFIEDVLVEAFRPHENLLSGKR